MEKNESISSKYGSFRMAFKLVRKKLFERRFKLGNNKMQRNFWDCRILLGVEV